MLIEAKKLIGLAVASEDELAKIGLITQIVVEPENGRLLGFLVATGFFATKALSIIDVKYWDPEGLVTGSEENLVEPHEIVRLKKVLLDGINLMNMPAVTESGKILGSVENFLVDTETQTVAKYYLRDLLGNARVMSPDQVIKIEKKIIFCDDEDKVGSPIIETQTA